MNLTNAKARIGIAKKHHKITADIGTEPIRKVSSVALSINQPIRKERGKKRANKTILGENNISQRKEKLGRKLAYGRR